MSTFNYELQHIKLEFEDNGAETKSWDYDIIITHNSNSYSMGQLVFKQEGNKMVISPKLNHTEANIASGTARRFLEDLIARLIIDDSVFNFIEKNVEISFNKNLYTTMLLEMSNIGKDIIIK